MLDSVWSIDSTYRYVWVEDIKSKEADFTDKDFDDHGHMVTI